MFHESEKKKQNKTIFTCIKYIYIKNKTKKALVKELHILSNRKLGKLEKSEVFLSCKFRKL